MAETIRSVLDKTTEYFKHHGIQDTPRLDAEVLLANVLKMDRIELYVNINRPMNIDELDSFREDVKSRARRMPVPYITGVKEFMSSQYMVNTSVLIPRPETEILLESVFDYVDSLGIVPKTCLDMGTGSGVIAIELAKKYESSTIMAVDISNEAIKVAQRNAQIHGVLERVKLYKGDIFNTSSTIDIEYIDLLVSNPPYVRTDELSELQREIVDYEPHSALDGGKDGYDYYKRICKEGSKYFRNGSIIGFEVGHGQAYTVGEICRNSGFNDISIINDYSGKERVIIGRIQ